MSFSILASRGGLGQLLGPRSDHSEDEGLVERVGSKNKVLVLFFVDESE